MIITNKTTCMRGCAGCHLRMQSLVMLRCSARPKTWIARVSTTSVRNISSKEGENPVLDDYRRRVRALARERDRNSEDGGVATPTKKQKRTQELDAIRISGGDLSRASIFNRVTQDNDHQQHHATRLINQQSSALLAGLDPNPNKRIQWERRQVIGAVRRGGQFTKSEHIAMTEREHTCKSPVLKTSIKKLSILAKQISQLPIDDAILQMRYSPKAVARDVRQFLEYARDQAIVKRGMGLGLPPPEPVWPLVNFAQVPLSTGDDCGSSTAAVKRMHPVVIDNARTTRSAQLAAMANSSITVASVSARRLPLQATTPDPSSAIARTATATATATATPTSSQLQSPSSSSSSPPPLLPVKLSRHTPPFYPRSHSQMYIAQAWVGRSKYGTGLLHRARGRVDTLRLPYTSLFIILKEERSRARVIAELAARAERKKTGLRFQIED